MTRAVIAIDPGLSGAIALLLDGEFVDMAEMPTGVKKSGRREVDARALFDILSDFSERGDKAYCIIEQVTAMPGQGVSGMFSFGDSFGVARALAPVVADRVALVRASTWKKALGLNSDKRYSLACARERFPLARPRLKLAKHEGLAEALLLAHYGHAEHKW